MAQKHSTTEKGQSLVELSLVFTLLLLLVGGIIDLGGMFYTSLALRDTVQEGAIYAATHPDKTADIFSRIKQSASFPVAADQITDIAVTCSGGSCALLNPDSTPNLNSCAGKEITIRIGYNHRLMMPVIPVVVGRQTVALRASVTGTIFQSQTAGCAKPQVSPTLTPVPYP